MDAAEPRKCKFTVQIDAAVDEQHAFEAPSFRFRFLEGSKKQTPVIGASGWSPMTSEEDPQETPPASSSWSAHPPQNAFRYEQVFQDVSITESFAKALDSDPILSFFLSDHPGLVGAPAAAASMNTKDAKGKSGAPPVATPSASTDNAASSATLEHTPKAYVGLYDVDMSSLLSGALQLEQVWTSGAHQQQLEQASSSTSVFSSKQAADQKKKKQQTPSRTLFLLGSGAGLRYLAIRVILDQPLLCATLTKRLNPLTITIGAIRRLPGITMTTTTRGVKSSPHAPLLQYCKPVYALLKFFPDKIRPRSQVPLADGNVIPRILATPGKPQDEHVEWDHSVTFLCARFSRAELVDALQYSSLTVEIHDRDLKQEEKLSKLQRKWETLHATGVDITAVTPQHTQGQNNQHTSEEIPTPGTGGASRTTTPRTGATHAQYQQQAPKSMEIFLVDDVAKQDCRLLLSRSGDFFPHGLATFRLNELLNKAKQLVGINKLGEDGTPFMALKLSSDVVAMKQRSSPLGAGAAENDEDPFAIFDLTPMEKLVREPGTYISSSTQLTIHVTLQHPITIESSASDGGTSSQSTCEVDCSTSARFSRMVLIIPYKDDRTLNQVAKVMAAVNLSALPAAPIRSYQMTEQEKHACESGQLDIITGTQIIDSHFRTIFLEGLADKGMKVVHEQIPRKGANDPQGYRMSANDQILFTRRLYTAFEIDLKRIKLRYPLPILMNSPDIYMRSKVSENCFGALTRLADVRQASRLEEIKNLDLFPTAQMLLEVESKYGESITLEDIHGSQSSRSAQQTMEVPSSLDALETSATNKELSPSSRASKRHTTTLKAPTDSTNDRFEQYRKSRKDKDFLDDRKKESDHVRSEYAEKKKLLDAQLKDQPFAPVYMYSGQKLRTQDALQDEMRRQLAKDHHATYTYSKDFQSLAVSLVDVDAMRQTEELENRKKWTTQRGFVYPAPRNSEEYYKHPDAPSEARCEDLREPFVDNSNHPKPVSRESSNNTASGSRSSPLPEFSTLPSKNMIFGGTNGDGTVNAEYFRSVHLCGDGLRLEQEEALKREQEEWERRLVVDKKQIKFLAHGNITSLPRKKPSQLDKITDILEGTPRSKPIRIVKNAALPSGKRVPLEAPPVTIHNQQEYAGSVATQFAATMRETDRTQFLATNADAGKPKDFLFPSNTDLLTPQVNKFTSRKEIVPMKPMEKQGLIWKND